MKSNMFYSVGPRKDTPRENYRIDKHDIKYMKQSVRAFEGQYIVKADADEFWCDGNFVSKPYVSKVLVNPTWKQLFNCAKAAQLKTGDFHHSFFEGAYVSTYDKDVHMHNGVPVKVLRLSLGS